MRSALLTPALALLVCTTVLPAQVTVTFVPNGGTFTNPSVGVTIKGCSNTYALNATSRVIKLNGVTITSQFSYVNDVDACTYSKKSVGTIQLQNGNNTLYAYITDTQGNPGSRTQTFTLSDKWPATLALAYADKFRDVSRCIADCFEAVAQYSTPTYTSLDASRGVTLMYRSDRARPRGVIEIEATDNSPTPVTRYWLRLRRPDGTFVQFENGATHVYFAGGAGVTRLAAQFDASALSSQAYDYTAVVQSQWSDGTTREATIPARVMVVNGVASPLGAGWEAAGGQTAHVQSDGVMIASGDGSVSFFGGCSGTCQLTSPPGDFSTLNRQGDGSYIRRYPDGTQYAFSSGGLLTSVTDRLGISTAIARDGSNRLSTITDPVGFAISFGYSGAGGTFSSITIPGNGTSRTSTFSVSGGNLEQASDPDGIRNFQASYSSNRLTALTDRRGGQWSYGYFTDGTLDYTDAPGVTVAGVPNTRPRVTVAAPSRLLLARVVNDEGTTTGNAIPRNADDLRAWVRNARTKTTYFTTNRWGSPKFIEFPLGPNATATYNTAGQITQTVAPNGHTINYTWNGVQLTQVQDLTTGQTVNATYESTYNRPLTISGNTVSRTFTYPNLRTITAAAGSHPADTIWLDYFGRDSVTKDGGGHVTKAFFASAGLRNTDSVEAPGARRMRLRYDAFGRVVARTNPAGERDSATYDLVDRQLTAVDASNKTTTFNYDSLFLRKVTDARGLEHLFVRNALGWVEQETRPGSTALTNSYDANGNVLIHTNRRGQQTTFGYDDMDRVTSRTANGATTTFSYLTATTESRVTAENAESADTLYVNAAGRLIRSATGRPGGNWYRIAYAYNTDGSLASTSATSSTWSGSKTQSWGYNATNATQSFTTWAGTTTLNPGTGNEDLATTITYPSGLALTRTFSSLHSNFNVQYNVTDVNNRLGAQVRIDANGRIAERLKPNADSARRYEYHPTGALSAQHRYQLTSFGGCSSDPNYGFGCTANYQWHGTDAFTYDDVGNLLNNGAQYAANSNRLTSTSSFTFSYDADGNMTFKGGTGFADQTLAWNALGQLESVTSAVATVTFGYDGFGRRVRKVVNGTTTRYLHDGDNLFMELDGNGAPVVEYAYWGLDNPHSMLKSGQTYYFVQDPVGGSVKGLVRHSDNSVQAQYGYTMFGQQETTIVDNVGNVLRFAGREYDSETGFYFNRARYLDPQTGRFVSEDPIGVVGGINLYSYAGNDPVQKRDPTGLWEECYYVQGAQVTAGPVTTMGGKLDGKVGGHPETTFRDPGKWVCTGAWDYPGQGLQNTWRIAPRNRPPNLSESSCGLATVDFLVTFTGDAMFFTGVGTAAYYAKLAWGTRALYRGFGPSAQLRLGNAIITHRLTKASEGLAAAATGYWGPDGIQPTLMKSGLTWHDFVPVAASIKSGRELLKACRD